MRFPQVPSTMSKALDIIDKIIEEHNPEKQTEYQLVQKIIEAYRNNGEPEDCREQYAIALAHAGRVLYWGWDNMEKDERMAFPFLLSAYELGNTNALEELGLGYYNGFSSPDGAPEKDKAMAVWEKGMEAGDNSCTFRWCIEKVNNDEADADVIARLEAIATDRENPIPDACAVLYYHYNREGEDGKAEQWREKGLDLGSEFMQQLIDDEKEEEVEEDSWTRPGAVFFPEDEDDDDEYEGHDDETEAAHPGYPEVGEKYVVIAATDDSFRIVQADASDWRSLPALIGASSCDDMRCEKFRRVSKELGLPGTLLGQLDKDGFRKRYLRPNWHASQWYDGSADLMGAMVICMEDASYNPFSFSSKEEAQRAIGGLCS